MVGGVLEFPARTGAAILVGPFEEWRVVVNGRCIPRLTGRYTSDGAINFVVDGRFAGGPFDPDAARQVAYLIAQALAVGSNFASIDADSKTRHFAPMLAEVGSMSE